MIGSPLLMMGRDFWFQMGHNLGFVANVGDGCVDFGLLPP